MLWHGQRRDRIFIWELLDDPTWAQSASASCDGAACALHVIPAEFFSFLTAVRTTQISADPAVKKGQVFGKIWKGKIDHGVRFT